ncbi:Appr-1-p processing protein [Armatimonas rosea]|uniref:O-acetyl-ADP-ribose deacetylase (Regulator of RNase III) n=1 Tax=Armatimonas rosea TaxID=685828 RepID=A0A7W9SLM9_ARMRO|nr:Appr-1-p processing protein [Armatimonas rosea]MBB6048927.1 O-acetyl-ADP-ribose deacetylase (regulator of RNase III) [Armatimonas rosea]
MTQITYLKGDATVPQAAGAKIVCHCCNDLGAWGKGFVRALSRRWQEPERAYRKWHAERAHNDFGLGAVQFVEVKPGELWVANLIGQRGIKTGSKGVPIRYDALSEGLEKVAEKALERGASIHLPRIGCGLAGGDWSRVEPLLQKVLCTKDIAVTVYDF